MRSVITGFDRGWHPSRIHGVDQVLRWAKESGYECVDPSLQDYRLMWDDTEYIQPRTAYRNMAMIGDVEALATAGVLLMIPGWEQYPESVAMYHVAMAMGKPTFDVPIHALSGVKV